MHSKQSEKVVSDTHFGFINCWTRKQRRQLIMYTTESLVSSRASLHLLSSLSKSAEACLTLIVYYCECDYDCEEQERAWCDVAECDNWWRDEETNSREEQTILCRSALRESVLPMSPRAIICRFQKAHASQPSSDEYSM